jgi:hypothetical protein
MAEHVSREVWAKRVERWGESNLTAAEFASELGINPRTLTYWKWRLGRDSRAAMIPLHKDQPAIPAPVVFAQVAASIPEHRAQSEPFEVVLDGLVVRVPVSFDEAALRRLLGAIRT